MKVLMYVTRDLLSTYDLKGLDFNFNDLNLVSNSEPPKLRVKKLEEAVSKGRDFKCVTYDEHVLIVFLRLVRNGVIKEPTLKALDTGQVAKIDLEKGLLSNWQYNYFDVY